MKRLLIPLLALLIPSAHAVDYVKCEAIRAVISRNYIQKGKVKKDASKLFYVQKLQEKFPALKKPRTGVDKVVNCYNLYLDDEVFKECEEFEKTIFTEFSDEFNEFIKPKLKPYEEREDRASKDWVKNDCF